MSIDRQRIDAVKTLEGEGRRWSVTEGWKAKGAPTPQTAAAPVSGLAKGPATPPATVPPPRHRSTLRCTEYTIPCSAAVVARHHLLIDSCKYCSQCGERVLP